MNIKTKYGSLNDCINPEYYPDGALHTCIVKEKSPLSFPTAILPTGIAIPQYHHDEVRRKYIASLTLYPAGTLRSLSLDESTNVQTSLGVFPAEFITFYESGAIKRLFPLNGKLSGYWSEKDEFARSVPFAFHFSFGDFTAKIISLHFYEDGALSSLTLAPGEIIKLHTSVGELSIRTGFSLYHDGRIESVEPANDTKIKTPLGMIKVFDPAVIGIHADKNSLQFKNNHLYSLKTTAPIAIPSPGKPCTVITPIKKPSPLDETIIITEPMTLTFHKNEFTILREKEEQSFDYA
ncbi:MAG: hypothetical protein WCS30_01490 [Selenomonadaceae bacterium]